MRPILIILLLASLVFAEATQTDWSGGQDTGMAQGTWGDTFESCDAAAWRSIPGQLSLASEPLADCSTEVISTDLVKPYTADCGDINGDGFTDILAGAYESCETVVWYGDGTGGWTAQQISTETMGCCGCDLADMDEDGDLDILMATYNGGRLLLYLNQGGSLPQWEEEVIATGLEGAHDVEAADMDLDGDLDLVLAAAELDKVFWYRNDAGSWTELEVTGSLYYPCRVHPLDIDGDGNMDIACAGYGTTSGASSVMVMYGSGGANPSWTEETVDDDIAGAHGIRAVDIDEDGDLDLVSAAMNESRTYLYTRDSGTWTRSAIGIFGACAIVKPADMDGDGDWDVVVSSFGTAGVSWWDNLGSGQWTRRVARTGGGGTSWVIPADVDNNGSLDILAVRFTQSVIEWHRVTEFQQEGSLAGSILDIDCTPEWAGITWDADLPASCQLGLQYRSADDPGDLGDWSETHWDPAFIPGELKRYFQYRLIMHSSNGWESPVLRGIELDWDLQGTSPGNPAAIEVVNPSRGSIGVMVEKADSLLTVYDLQGRMVCSRRVGTAGFEQLEELAPGFYTVVLSEYDGPPVGRTVAVLPR